MTQPIDDGVAVKDPPSVGHGRYLLGESLGSGGTARVYRGVDTHLRVPRAIKILRGDRSFRDELRPRLHAEARVMASLRHPNILAVYDFGAEDDCDWVVMELAEGGSLDDRQLREGRLSAADAVDYGLQILSGLGAAHAANVVHRDIKPQNVLLDSRGIAHLADFGIALFAAESADRITRTGVSMGSFAYMPPEQRIDARSVGASADIYAVGATLYVLLTGRTPVDLFAADVRSARWGNMPESLAAVIRKATRFDPRERFATALEMAEALADAASREQLLDRTVAAGSYAIFSATTMPRIADPTLPASPEFPSPSHEPVIVEGPASARGSTFIVSELQNTDVHPLEEAPPVPVPSAAARRADARRRRIQLGAGAAFGVPILLFVAFVGWSLNREDTPVPSPEAPAAAPVVTPSPAAPVETPPDTTPALPAPAAGTSAPAPVADAAPVAVERTKVAPTPTTKAAPRFAHPELVGRWAGNWGQGVATITIGADGATSGKVGVGFGGGKSEPLSGKFRWSSDALRLEGARYHGRFVTVVFDGLSPEKITGYIEDSPGERLTLHPDR